MSKQVFDMNQFRKGLKGVAQKGALFLNTAYEVFESAPANPLRKDGTPTKAFSDHVEAFRALLMEKGEDTPRNDWAIAGQPDGSYRGYVTHMKNAVVGIAVSGDDAAGMSFKALAATGKAVLSPPKAKEAKENPMDELLVRAAALMSKAPRDKGVSQFDKDVSQFLADLLATFAKDGDE